MAQFASVPATWPDVSKILSHCELDPYFGEFYSFTKRAGIEMAIVSDGFDLFINHMFERSGLSGLQIFANSMTFDSGRIELAFPREEEGCGHCGMCKKVPLGLARPKFEQIIFIGNGLSDLCAVPLADVVFAKAELAEYCEIHKIPFIPFHDFCEVISVFRSELSKLGEKTSKPFIRQGSAS